MNIINYILQIPLTLAQTTTAVQNTAQKVQDGTQSQLSQLIGFIFTQIPLWITAIIVVILTFIISRIVKAMVQNKLDEKGLNEENQELEIIAVRGSNIIVLTIGITAALGIIGIDFAPIVAAGAFGIGFALKDLIMNMIAGMLILGGKQFKIGDVISINGTTGVIQEILTRTTVIKAFDGTKIIIPNSDFFNNKVINKWGNGSRKIKITVGVEYQTDLNLAIKCIKHAISQIPAISAKPKPGIKLIGWGESSINILIYVWVSSAERPKYMKIKHDLINNITKLFRKYGVGFAFPVYTSYNYDSELTVGVLPKQPGGYLAKNVFNEKKPAKQIIISNQPLTPEQGLTVPSEVVPAAVSPVSETTQASAVSVQAVIPTQTIASNLPGAIESSIPATITAQTTPVASAPTPPIGVVNKPDSANAEGASWLQNAYQQTQANAPVEAPIIQAPLVQTDGGTAAAV
jgi:small conductance mechanosensitive channel